MRFFKVFHWEFRIPKVLNCSEAKTITALSQLYYIVMPLIHIASVTDSKHDKTRKFALVKGKPGQISFRTKV